MVVVAGRAWEVMSANVVAQVATGERTGRSARRIQESESSVSAGCALSDSTADLHVTLQNSATRFFQEKRTYLRLRARNYPS